MNVGTKLSQVWFGNQGWDVYEACLSRGLIWGVQCQQEIAKLLI